MMITQFYNRRILKLYFNACSPLFFSLHYFFLFIYVQCKSELIKSYCNEIYKARMYLQAI